MPDAESAYVVWREANTTNGKTFRDLWIAGFVAGWDAALNTTSVSCSYCSFEAPGPVKAGVVQAHIQHDCEYHPLRAAERELDGWRTRAKLAESKLEHDHA